MKSYQTVEAELEANNLKEFVHGIIILPWGQVDLIAYNQPRFNDVYGPETHNFLSLNDPCF